MVGQTCCPNMETLIQISYKSLRSLKGLVYSRPFLFSEPEADFWHSFILG